MTDDQQFCLKWNNFQANITSQFETLRDDEDFTDVTIACGGQRIQAHKVVLSACSPFFKELFKSNPCSHPIIFMRDVEACHIVSLLEFMYAGQVNIAQANLSTFLRTAESFKVRGLTDTSETFLNQETDTLYLNPQPKKATVQAEKLQISSTNNVSSSQDVPELQSASSPPPKKSKTETDISNPQKDNGKFEISDNIDSVELVNQSWQPKDELPDYLSDVDEDDKEDVLKLPVAADLTKLPGNMEIFSRSIQYHSRENKLEAPNEGLIMKSPDYYANFANHSDAFISNSPETSFLSTTYDGEGKNKLLKLADGIEICEDQLRGVKWNDYRKLTRGLAAILFSPAELATCSVTGQRWSRAGTVERPVKPALDKVKVQAIISYVATQFPMVEISRIKQVLAYKCKENSTALKMKAFRYYSHPISQLD